ncbi:MAG: hypothetical protein LW860_05985 [Xanthomonadaceae bacterium]|jgi:hypothetical protein|nr:hypothetical protein [Xanthomonadaceae bacterium]
MHDADLEALHAAAYEAFERPDLAAAVERFEDLLARVDDDDADRPAYHYMAGLACKYLGRWKESLAHNLASLAHRDEVDEASAWNAGIAATALGDWGAARRAWATAGLQLPGGEGPIDGDFGVCSVRLNPSGNGETVFADRIDVVRARIANIPLPVSGFAFGDIVLHDGAATGRRSHRGQQVAVFNGLQRLQRSAFHTFTAFVIAPTPADAEALEARQDTGLGAVEDWTRSVATLCLRCSYGLPHQHESNAPTRDAPAWKPMRNVGIAAVDVGAARAALDLWRASGPGRVVEHIEAAVLEVAAHRYDHCWWEAPDPAE